MPRFNGIPVDEQAVEIASAAKQESAPKRDRFGGVLVESDPAPKRVSAYDTPLVRQAPIAEEQSAGGGFMSRVGDTALDVAKGAVELGQSAVGLGGLATGGLLTEGMRALGYDPERTTDFLSSLYSDARKVEEQELKAADGAWDTAKAVVTNPGMLVGKVAETALGTLGIMGVARKFAAKAATAAYETAVAGGMAKEAAQKVATDAAAYAGTIAAAASEGAQQAGSSFDQLVGDGIELGKAYVASLGSGVTTGGIALVGGKLGQKLGLGDVEAGIAGKGGLPGRIAGGMAQEGLLEEAPQSATEQMWQNYATDKPLGEGVEKAAATGGIIGAAAGGGFALLNRQQDEADSGAGAPTITPGAPSSDTRGQEIQPPAGPTEPPAAQPLDPYATKLAREGQDRQDIIDSAMPDKGDRLEVNPKLRRETYPSGGSRVQRIDPDEAALLENEYLHAREPADLTADQQKLRAKLEDVKRQIEVQADEKRIEPLRAERDRILAELKNREPDYFDPRLKRELFRGQAMDMVTRDLAEGGGISLVPDLKFKPGESDSPGRIPLVRTSSVNPPWAQNLMERTGLTVKQVREAVEKAIAGDTLGVRQREAVAGVLDEIQGERTDGGEGRYRREAILKARELRSIFGVGVGLTPGAIMRQDAAPDTWAFDDFDYAPELNEHGRIIIELLQEARALGEDYADHAERLVERSVEDQQVIRDLAELIKGAKGGIETEIPSGIGSGPVPAMAPVGLPAPAAPGIATAAGLPSVEPGTGAGGTAGGYAQPISQPVAAGPRFGGVATATAEALAPAAIPEPAQTQEPQQDAEIIPIDRRKKKTVGLKNERRQGDRRKDEGRRKLVAEMSQEELRKEVLTSKKTGLGNERAYEESEKLPYQVFIDLDGMKYINDTYSHDAGDEFLGAFGEIVNEVTGDGYHLSGDEFMVQAINESAARRMMKEIEAKASEWTEYDQADGIQFSYGIGKTKAAAEKAMYAHKAQRKAEGKATERGEKPKGDIEAAANEAATSPQNDKPEPTDGQKEAGNYAKGKIRLNGLDISIENPAGSKRNPEWPALANHYGYIRKTEGADGDHVDVFLTDAAENLELPVVVIDQINPETGAFDEHKVVIGATSVADARKTYAANYSKDWKGYGGAKAYTWDEFKTWLKGDTTAPVSPEVKAKKAKPPKKKGPADVAKKKYTFKIKPEGDGFVIESDNGGGIVVDGKPMPMFMGGSKARIFKSRADAEAYARKKGMEIEADQTPPQSGVSVYDSEISSVSDISWESMGKAVRDFLKQWVEAQGPALLSRLRNAAEALWNGNAGASTTEDISLLEQLYESGEPIREWLRGKADADGFVTLFRGLRNSTRTSGHAVESYTLSRRVAKNFAGEDGEVVERRVHVDDVITLANEPEQELLVRIIDKSKKSTITPSVKTETDLLGEVPVKEQAIADAKREKDAKRNGRRDVPMDAPPGTLFNQGQQDIEDAAGQPAQSESDALLEDIKRLQADSVSSAEQRSGGLDAKIRKLAVMLDDKTRGPEEGYRFTRAMDSKFENERVDAIERARGILADGKKQGPAPDPQIPGAAEAVKKYSLPEETKFRYGKGSYKDRISASVDGADSNYLETADAAAKDLAQVLVQRREWQREAERDAAFRQKVADKLRAGENPTFDEWKAAFPQLKKGHTYLRQPDISPFLIEHFGFKANNIKAGLGAAAGTVTTDSGTKYPIVYFNKLADVLGQRSGPSDQPAYSRKSSEQPRDLLIQHNLTAANLLHAARMGGIPVPSLAVTRKDHPLQNFGEITLLGPASMADPKGDSGTQVFGSDIYSPRYPSVEYQFTPNMRARVEKMLADGIEATDGRIDWDEIARRGPDEMARTAPFMWKFLKDKGIDPTIVRIDVKPLPKQISKFVKDGVDSFDLNRDPAFSDAVYEYWAGELTKAYDGDRAAADAEIAQDRARAAERGVDYFVRDWARQVDKYKRNARNNGQIDGDATRRALANQVREADLTDEINTEAEKLFEDIGPNERIFQGFTYAGKRRYTPHTLENVVKILKKELRGGESAGNVYGVGQLRAKFTPRFRSVEQMRKEKGRLTSKEDFKKIKDEIDADFFALADALKPYYDSNPDSMRYPDTVMALIEDSAKMGLSRAAKEYGFSGISDDARQQMFEFVTRLKTLPTEYFEAKILRGVSLSEFAGAVVPENVDPAVLAALKDNGITDIRTYKRGDEADRARVIGGFDDLMFSRKAMDTYAEHSIDPEDVPVGDWAGRVLFHGTSDEGAANIHSEGINNEKSNSGYFGPGFYVASDANLAANNYADFADEDGGEGSVIAIRVKKNARILDLRSEKDWDVYQKASGNGKDISRRDFDKIMVRAGIDGLFDRSFGGLVIYNPKAIEVLPDEPMKYLRNKKRPAASVAADLESALRKPLAALRKLFPVNVVQSVADLPGNHPADVRGMFSNGAVWLVADNLPANEAAEALAHEAVGHLGLETLLGPQMFNDLVKIVQTQKRMGSKRIKAIVAQLEKSYTDADGKYALDARQEAREILAHIAEGKAELLTGSALQKLYQRIKAKIRMWLAARGFGNMEDALIDSLIVRAARMVQGEYRGAGTMQGQLAYSRQAQAEMAPIFYSQMQRTLDAKLPNTGSSEQMKQAIRAYATKGEFKAEELEWSGVEEWLNSQIGRKITKAQVLEFLRANEIQVTETVLGSAGQASVRRKRIPYDTGIEWLPGSVESEGYELVDRNGRVISEHETLDEAVSAEKEHNKYNGDTKFANYKLPGGENYRELLLTLPSKTDRENIKPSQAIIDKYDSEWQEIVREIEAVPAGSPARESTMLKLDDLHKKMVDETIAQLPKSKIGGNFKSSHFDQPNILAHVRFNERTDADGKRVLFIEEIQSDWHQKGRKEGYSNKRITGEVRKQPGLDTWAVYWSDGTFSGGFGNETNALVYYNNEFYKRSSGVPNAPFKTTWPMLAMKRMIRYAAENGFDRIAWTTGEQQAERYDLSKQVQSLGYQKNDDGTYKVSAQTRERGGVMLGEAISESSLEDYVGKDVAKKIIDGEGKKDEWQNGMGGKSYWFVLSGLDLKVGGEGMRGFYDQILPKEVNKYVKKWGGKVGRSSVDTGERGGSWAVIDATDEGEQQVLDRFDSEESARRSAYEDHDGGVDVKYIPTGNVSVHAIDITPAMRDAAMQGQPLYQRVYHGSPHTFDRFSTDKIGTGEGAQAYGYGLYFAGRKEVAEYYRGKLTGGRYEFSPLTREENKAIPDWVGRGIAETDRSRVLAIKRAIDEFSARKKEAINEKRTSSQPWLVDERISGFSKTIASLNKLMKHADENPGDVGVRLEGRLYEVELAPQEDEYLLWDKPLSEQSEKVKDSLRSIGMQTRGKPYDFRISLTGREAYRQIGSDLQDSGLTLDTRMGPDEAASKYLHSSGIRGIKYLDGSSRGKGDGSYNYVIFDENDAKIEAVYSRKSQTETPEFRRWFGDSKVVDADGKPLVVYHGSKADITAFRSAADRGHGPQSGIYFTQDRGLADTYSGRDGVMYPVHLSIKKPLDLTVNYDLGTLRSRLAGLIAPKLMAAAKNEQSLRDNTAQSLITPEERARIEAAGFDGIKGEGGVWIAFRPEQIKSAIGNRGTFDGNDPNILYSRKAKPAEPASLSDIEATLFDELRFKAQDKFHYLSKVQKKAMADRGVQALPEAEDAYLAELRYHGMAGAAIEDFQREHVDPLLEVISKSGLSVDDVDLYLQARHAKEANAQLARINPDREDNEALSGMSNEEAVDILKRLDSPAMRDIGARVDAITKARRDKLVESGLETQETVDAWESAYKHYVPLKREGFDGRLPSKGMGFNTRGKEKRRAGSNREVVHVLANVVAQYEATAIKAEKVKVGKAFLEFARNNPNPDLYEVDKVEYKPTFDAEGLVTYREDRGFIMADNVLVVRVNGVDHRITFNQQNPVALRIAHAMNNLGATESGPIVNALSKLTRWLAIVNTGANPEFVISNFARDLQTAGYNLSATAADKLKWKIIKDVGKSWRGIRSFQKQDGRHHEWAQYFDEFRKAGAQTGWLQSYSSIEDREQALIQKIRDMGRDTTGLKVKAGLKAVIEFIENENTAVENAIRLSAFVHARRAGMTEAQAAKIAKEMTVNFNRKGDMGQVLNALYLFYNASIQGSVRLLQAVAKSRKVQIMAGATVIFAAVLDIINRSLGGDDDDGEAKYDKIPDFVKERNLIIMLPSGGGDYIKIPLPWGYNVLHVMGQGVGESLTQRDFQAGKSAMRVAASAVSAFNPIGGSESLLQFLSPTITDPLVQWAENKDWAGKPLRPASNPFGVDTPNSQKYWNSVRAPSKWLTDTLNELTGGDEVRPGAIDISPEAVDLLVDTFTGGAGRFVSDTIATPMKALTGEELETYEVPVLRKVYGAPGMGTVVSDFYERMEAVQVTDKQLKHYKGDHAKIAEIRRKHAGEVRLLGDMKIAQSQLRKLRKQIKLYEKNGNETALKSAREREKEIMQRFNKAYNNKMGRFREAS